MRRPVPCRPCANAASPRSASAQMMISCSWSSSFLSCGGNSAVQGQRTRSAAKIYKCSARSANTLARLRGRRETGNRPNSERRARNGEAEQRGANLPTASVRPFLRSRLLSGDGSVDVVKHELLAYRVEGAEILYCCCPGGGSSRRDAERRRAQRGRLRR